jgi:hypothetical protein
MRFTLLEFRRNDVQISVCELFVMTKNFLPSTVFGKCESSHFQIGHSDLHLESSLVHTHSLVNDTVQPL